MFPQTAALNILVLTKLYFVDHLRRLGHRVVTAGFNSANFELYPDDITAGAPLKGESCLGSGFDLQFSPGVDMDQIFAALPAGFWPDVILYSDDSNPILYVNGIERVTVPTIFFSVDAHLHVERHKRLGGMFDKVLVAQKDYVPAFAEHCPDAAWFPLFTRVAPTDDKPRDLAVSFRGGLDPRINARRAAFIEAVKARIPLDAGTGPFCDAFCRSRIVLNQALKGDVNFRVYEAMACGALVVTPRLANGQPELFKSGEHLVEYEDDNPEDAARKIRHYLDRESEAQAIAAAGRRETLEKHTEWRRAEQLIDHLAALQPRHKRACHSGAAYQYLHSAELQLWVFDSKDAALKRLRNAKECVVAAMIARETITPQLISDFLNIRYLLGVVDAADEAFDMLHRTWLAARENGMIHAVYLDALVQRGREAEALAIVRGFYSESAKMLRQAREVARQLDQTINAQMEKKMSNSRRVDPSRMR
jgi:hypothetical protein